MKRKSGHWEHKSFRFRFERFTDTWTLVLLPGYVFTTDGKFGFLERDLVNRLSTKREGRDYNSIVHNDLVFWAWVLSGGKPSTFALQTGHGDVQNSPVSLNENHDSSNEPQILVKANLSTTVVRNVEAEDVLPTTTDIRDGLWAQHHNVEADDVWQDQRLESLELNQLTPLESAVSQSR